MSQAADQTRFGRYQEALIKQDLDELRAEREHRRVKDDYLFTKKSQQGQQPAISAQLTKNKTTKTTPSSKAVSEAAAVNNDYFADVWTEAPAFMPERKTQKKTVALRWLDPDWSIVRWFKSIFSDEDAHEEQYHHDVHHHHDVVGNKSQKSNAYQDFDDFASYGSQLDVLPPEMDMEK